ncbi:MAG: 2-hydroxyacyl-CoA dehydratase subunit D [Candidatus Baldrarchaeia archaeon]
MNIDDLLNDPIQYVKKTAQSCGRNVVAFFPVGVPIELIHAANLQQFPLIIMSEDFSAADAYMHTFACSLSRSVLQKFLSGDLDFVKAFIIPDICDSLWSLYNIVKLTDPNRKLYLFHYPPKKDDKSLNYFKGEIIKLWEFLKELSLSQSSEEILKDSITKFNEQRKLLRKLNNMRKSNSPPFSGTDFFKLMLAAFFMPVEHHIDMLNSILGNIEKWGTKKEGVRLLVSGHMVENVALIELIEESGGLIVADDMDIGSRHFSQDLAVRKDIFAGIAEHYLMTPSPYRHSVEDRAEYILKLAKEFDASGVIFLIRKFCDPYLFDYPILRRMLEEEGIPSLLLEYEFPFSAAILRNRVEAFIEMLR